MRLDDYVVPVVVLAFALILFGVMTDSEMISSENSSRNVAGLATDVSPADDYSEAVAAYSLRKLIDSYTGPALTVRREDGNTRDIGFASDGYVDIDALEAFSQGGDVSVTDWHDQAGGPSLANADLQNQPLIVVDGQVVRAETGMPAIRALYGQHNDDGGTLSLRTGDRDGVNGNSYRFGIVSEVIQGHPDGKSSTIIGMSRNHKLWEGIWYRSWRSYLNGAGEYGVTADGSVGSWDWRPIVMRNSGEVGQLWSGQELVYEGTVEEEPNLNGNRYVDEVELPGFSGHISEFVVFDSYGPDDWPIAYHLDAAEAWDAGPLDWNEDALLLQRYDYQVKLYDWMESVSVDDVTLDTSSAITWDPSGFSTDEIADVWLLTRGLSASSSTRGEPDWFVLDAGNGKGIEATGEVRLYNEPAGSCIGSHCGGNPPRGFSNEPAFFYALDLTNADGSQGNPYYKDPAMGRRALVVAMTDMMMMHECIRSGQSCDWSYMHGRATQSWAETYLHTKDLLDPATRQAYEDQLKVFYRRLRNTGYLAVNTNLDLFHVKGAAAAYMAAEDPELKQLALESVKRGLLGYPDGELGVKHKVFAAHGNDGGVYHPAGGILEGDQLEMFYQGESYLHLAGALAAVTDRQTGAVPDDWQFLQEMLEDMEKFRNYQIFYDPGRYQNTKGPRADTLWTAGAGYVGRTGAPAPSGQADAYWKHALITDVTQQGKARLKLDFGVRSENNMLSGIASKLTSMSDAIANTYVGTPKTWKYWSPWVKQNAYLPPEGWHGRLSAVQGTDAALPPILARDAYNEKFGGYPSGDDYWAYKNSDGDTSFGWFIETQAHQGSYSGWYGGKIETFWTEPTGVVLLNRHGKGGCDKNDRVEDSGCWVPTNGKAGIEDKAGHHVWGRDENGNAFTTLFIKGRNLNRPVSYDLASAVPTVTVTNNFNDPAAIGNGGEQTSATLEGAFSVTNTFAARGDGLGVTHTVRSDGSDELTALHATLPVYLKAHSTKRGGDKPQLYLEDTSIEYWDGSSWRIMPEDTDGDGVPEYVETSKLRLGRDYQLGDGIQYVYVHMLSVERVRLSAGEYNDPYQTQTSVRAVHIDMHGNPGTAKTLSEASTTYFLTVNEERSPDLEEPAPIPIPDEDSEEQFSAPNVSIAPVSPQDESVSVAVRSNDEDFVRAAVQLNGAYLSSVDEGESVIELPALQSGEHVLELVAVFSSGTLRSETTLLREADVDPSPVEPVKSVDGQKWVHALEGESVEFVSTSEDTSLTYVESYEAPALDRDVYRYFQLESTVDTAAEIVFSVPDEWLAFAGLAPEEVALFRFVDDWVELDTSFDGDSYLALTPGFSYFAIGSVSDASGDDGSESGGDDGSQDDDGSSSSGGGGFSGSSCNEEVSCDAWSACHLGLQRRSCTDICGEPFTDVQECQVDQESGSEAQETTENVEDDLQPESADNDSGVAREESPSSQPVEDEIDDGFDLVWVGIALLVVIVGAVIVAELRVRRKPSVGSQIESYIEQYEGQYSEDQLRQQLLDAGWNSDEIDEAFKNAK